MRDRPRGGRRGAEKKHPEQLESTGLRRGQETAGQQGEQSCRPQSREGDTHVKEVGWLG